MIIIPRCKGDEAWCWPPILVRPDIRPVTKRALVEQRISVYAGPTRSEVLDRLQAGIQQLTASARWTAWLRFCRRFRRYSFQNQILILSQRPTATWVAGYRAWQEMGRQVRRGERGIAILAPVRIADHSDPSDEDRRELAVAFRVVRVFDLEQTEGPVPPKPLDDLGDMEQGSELPRLLDQAAALGFAIEFAELHGERHGDCSHTLRRIRLRQGMGSAQTFKTAAHELAHAILHGPEFKGDRALAELEAESVAYVVCDGVGVDSSAYSFGYLASWAGGGEAAARVISQAGTRISAAAGEILERAGYLRAG